CASSAQNDSPRFSNSVSAFSRYGRRTSSRNRTTTTRSDDASPSGRRGRRPPVSPVRGARLAAAVFGRPLDDFFVVALTIWASLSQSAPERTRSERGGRPATTAVCSGAHQQARNSLPEYR